MSSKSPEEPNKKEKQEPFNDFFKSMNHFFQEKPVKGFLQSIDEFFNNPFPFPSSSFHVEMKETDQEYIVLAELPGIKKEQIHIDIFENRMKISVKNHSILAEEDDKRHIYKRQQPIQQSSRTITFHQPIDEKKVKASYEDGLLSILIQKGIGKKINID
ncbi:Hsp20/alpha crystallin family protein [Bacillus sp. 03113]|uniref:Hsp20/alpha crystallin family protein n=1 Tax=Bacillus sp. 03113 TaxID=2578211 RepID=UPI0011414BEB|nr:Hsp20/alpha crystallin family protein [Bacillus sp. 03113]